MSFNLATILTDNDPGRAGLPGLPYRREHYHLSRA